MISRLKILLALTAFSSLCFGSSAVSVSCHQRWPWNGKVDIDYVLQSSAAEPMFNVIFYGKIGDGESIRLTNLNGDGSSGLVVGAGEKRVTWDASAQFPSTSSDNFKVALAVEEIVEDPEYMILNLDDWTFSYANSTNQTTIAVGSDSKISEMWFRKIEPGTFMMGCATNEWDSSTAANEPLHSVEISKKFYISIFETTEAQYDRIASDTQGVSCLPKTRMSYDALRGAAAGATWPSQTDHRVDSDSFLGVFRAKLGNALVIDLPTEAQWEMACRSKGDGTFIGAGCWNDGSPYALYNNKTKDDNLANLAWYSGNSGSAMHEVGLKKPNLVGLYYMHGNVWEWCVDWFANSYGLSRQQLSQTTVDPVGGSSGSGRCRRAGSYSGNPTDMRISSRRAPMNGSTYADYGFRLVINMF